MGHIIQRYSFRWKPKIQSHDWLSRDIENYLLINMKKTRGGHTSEQDKKKYETSVIGSEERGKGTNYDIFTSCFVLSFLKEFGSFTPTPNKQ